jgi:hypothetical protein
MRRAVLFWLVLVCCVCGNVAEPQEAPGRPEWARGAKDWGVLEVPQAVGDHDLEQVVWKRGMLVAQDRHDTIYVLDPSRGEVQEYTSRGERHGGWHVEGWQPLEAVADLSAFASDRYGDVFAFASQDTLRVFDQKKVLASARLPTFVTGLAFAGSDILAARLPVRFVHPTTKTREPPKMERSFLVSRLDAEGQTLDESLKPDEVEGADLFSLALTQAARIAVDQQADEGAICLADEFRTYRVRWLSRTGALKAEWHDPVTKGEVAFAGPVPKEVEGMFTKEAVTTGYHPVGATPLVRDVAVRDGIVFVLLEPGAVGERSAVDIFLDSAAGPLWRLTLHSAAGAPRYGRLLVTDSDFWLFPVTPGAHPKLVERFPDDVIRQATMAASAHSSE